MILLVILAYIFFLIAFVLYSYWGINHISTYGYIGDSTHTMKIIYIVVSSIVILTTVVLLITMSMGII